MSSIVTQIAAAIQAKLDLSAGLGPVARFSRINEIAKFDPGDFPRTFVSVRDSTIDREGAMTGSLGMTYRTLTVHVVSVAFGRTVNDATWEGVQAEELERLQVAQMMSDVQWAGLARNTRQTRAVYNPDELAGAAQIEASVATIWEIDVRHRYADLATTTP